MVDLQLKRAIVVDKIKNIKEDFLAEENCGVCGYAFNKKKRIVRKKSKVVKRKKTKPSCRNLEASYSSAAVVQVKDDDNNNKYKANCIIQI